MTSFFAAESAAGYELLMGRWSRRLAPRFIEFAAVDDATTVLDLGCGTGSLSLALADALPRAGITGIDISQAYIDFARSKVADPRLSFERGDAMALPYADRTFDAALSLLALNFIPDAEKAVREMARVTNPGGVVAGSVWDFRGGLLYLRLFADTAAVLDPEADRLRSKLVSTPLTGGGELAAMWKKVGLSVVKETSLMIRMEYKSFADYWSSFMSGQGVFGPWVTGLGAERRSLIEQHVRRAYFTGGEDGARSFTATAWTVRGIR